MLVLARKRYEKIMLGGANGVPLVELVVVEIRGDRVRLGISAPPEVVVDREEVHAAKQRQLARSGTDGAS